MRDDPVATDPDLYRTVFENDDVRVLEYRDRPGARTHPHWHPNSVMVALSGFRRRLHAGDEARDVDIREGLVSWLPSQIHSGENIGETDTHVIFVELKASTSDARPSLGPATTTSGSS